MSKRAYVGVGVDAAVIAAGLIGASLLGARDGDSAPQTISGTETTALLDGIPQQGPVLGRADSPETLVEFADVQCPYCAQWSRQAFADIVRDYVRPGKVRLVFRGLAFLGPDSEKGVRFAYAAGRQGKLWDVVHLLYANQGAENSGWVTDELLRDIAATAPGLDAEEAFDGSSSPEVDAELAAAQAASDRLEIRGTPSFAATRTGGELSVLEVASLDDSGLRPALDELLAR